MEQQTIAWADSQDMFGYRSGVRLLQEGGIEVIRYRHALSLLDACKRQKYPLIVTDIELAPGSGYEKESEFARIMSRTHHGSNPDYSEILLQTIHELRALDAHYAQVPILVVTTVSPETDGLYPRAQARALEAGATEYYCTFTENNALKGLVEKITRYVKGAQLNVKRTLQKPKVL